MRDSLFLRPPEREWRIVAMIAVLSEEKIDMIEHRTYGTSLFWDVLNTLKDTLITHGFPRVVCFQLITPDEGVNSHRGRL
jgi:hypothetical protein